MTEIVVKIGTWFLDAYETYSTIIILFVIGVNNGMTLDESKNVDI